MGIFSKINFGLTKTRNKMAGAIDDLLDSVGEINDDLYTELEELLVMHDVGVQTSLEIIEELRKRVPEKKIKNPTMVKDEIKEIVAEKLYGGEDMGLITIPSIIFVIGVNGVGKTTTIGKLAAMYKSEGKKVILGAADTFRAAAIDQLQIWADRAGVDIVKHTEGADPAAVVFDTINAAKARNCDIVIIDTAGRLHNKKNLMDELAKINRIIDNKAGDCSREVLLVLDATTGQNAVNQAKLFSETAPITGIVLTKLDGTAKGGIVISIKNELGIPVKLIGVGEKIDDLQPFDSNMFVDALFAADTSQPEDEEEGSAEELAEDTAEEEVPVYDEETDGVADEEYEAETADVEETPEEEISVPVEGPEPETVPETEDVAETDEAAEEEATEETEEEHEDESDSDEETETQPQEEVKPKKKGFFSRLFGGKDK